MFEPKNINTDGRYIDNNGNDFHLKSTCIINNMAIFIHDRYSGEKLTPGDVAFFIKKNKDVITEFYNTLDGANTGSPERNVNIKNVDIKIETPRGTMKIHTEYASKAEATKDGWGVWFQHGDVFILGRENSCGAICPAEY